MALSQLLTFGAVLIFFWFSFKIFFVLLRPLAILAFIAVVFLVISPGMPALSALKDATRILTEQQPAQFQSVNNLLPATPNLTQFTMLAQNSIDNLITELGYSLEDTKDQAYDYVDSLMSQYRSDHVEPSVTFKTRNFGNKNATKVIRPNQYSSRF